MRPKNAFGWVANRLAELVAWHGLESDRDFALRLKRARKAIKAVAPKILRQHEAARDTSLAAQDYRKGQG